jgi:hypothetical protein
MAGSCEHGNEPSGLIKGGEFLLAAKLLINYFVQQLTDSRKRNNFCYGILSSSLSCRI